MYKLFYNYNGKREECITEPAYELVTDAQGNPHQVRKQGRVIVHLVWHQEVGPIECDEKEVTIGS